jgi:tetratricopeptide (TPR) repeat protein
MLQNMQDSIENLQGPARDWLRAEILVLWATYHNNTGDYHQAAACATQAVELAQLHHDILAEIRGKNVWATACRYQSDYPKARELYLSSLNLAETSINLAPDPDLFSEGMRPFIHPRVSTRNLLAEVHLGLGVVNEIQGEYIASRQSLEKALKLYREINNQLGESRVLNSLGVVENNLNDLVAAREYYEQAWQIKHMMGDRFGEGITLGNLGVLMEKQHHLTSAIEYFERSLEICREIQDEEGVEAALIGLGNNHHVLGEYQHAQAALEEALAISRKIGDRQGEGSIQTSLGELHNDLGQPEAGITFLKRSIQIAEEIGVPSESAYGWYCLGHSYELLGQSKDSRQAYQRSMELRQELGQERLILDSRAGIASALLSLGDRSNALEMATPVLQAINSGAFNDLGQPVKACLVCFDILVIEQPELARQALKQGIGFLMNVAQEIKDEERKNTFLQRPPQNKRLLELWRNSDHLTRKEEHTGE